MKPRLRIHSRGANHRRAHTRTRALLIQLCLALSLLVAQSVAQAHAYSHYGKTDFSSTAGQLCRECLSSAPLLGAAGTPDSPRVSFIANVVLAAPAADAPCVEQRHEFAFRSRAPPRLL